MLEQIVVQAPVFLLAFGRCFALLMSMPLFSMRNVPRVAKLALAGYMAYLIFPHVDFSLYAPFLNDDGAFSLSYILILAGEIFIGIITGFFVTIIFTAFSTAGQFFAFQMGFSASEVYDALNQVENPLMGQFFNFIALLIFLQNHWAQRLFGGALVASFEAMNVLEIITDSGRNEIISFLLRGLTELFADAFLIALPVMGTLVLISVSMGLLSKAAPQMNLMSEGFPIMILVTFFIIAMLIGNFCEYFISSFASGFRNLEFLFAFFGGNGS